MAALASPLLSLPRELRDKIYAHLFACPLSNHPGRELQSSLSLNVSSHIPKSPLGAPGDASAKPFSMLAPLCKTCKFLYWEATPLYLSSCTLKLEDSLTTKWFIGWLENFGDDGFKAIRHLEFADFSRYEEERLDHDLLSLCPNIRTLALNFRHTENMLKESPSYGPNPPGCYQINFFTNSVLNTRKSNLIVEAWRLDRVLDLPKLDLLAFEFPDELVIPARQGLGDELRAWFLKSWSARRRWVIVNYWAVPHPHNPYVMEGEN